jgi:hypothetical protein
VSQANELSTLVSAGITAINLTPTGATTDLGNGNNITGTATVVRNGGNTQVAGVGLTAGNLGLASNPFYREFPAIPVSNAARALPEMGGSGWVRDLREAMSTGGANSETLRAKVQQFEQATTRDAQRGALDALLVEWARSTGKLDGEWTSAFYTGSAREFVVRSVVRTDYVTQTVHCEKVAGVESKEFFSYLFDDLSLTSTPSNLPGERGMSAAGVEWMNRKNLLEIFNGQRFISFDFIEAYQVNGGVGGAGGGGGNGQSGGSGGSADGYVPPREVGTVSVTNRQSDLIDQAYGECLNCTSRRCVRLFGTANPPTPLPRHHRSRHRRQRHPLRHHRPASQTDGCLRHQPQGRTRRLRRTQQVRHADVERGGL